MKAPTFIREYLARREAQEEFDKLDPMTHMMPLWIDWQACGYPPSVYDELLSFHLNPEAGRESLTEHCQKKFNLPTWQPQ